MIYLGLLPLLSWHLGHLILSKEQPQRQFTQLRRSFYILYPDIADGPGPGQVEHSIEFRDRKFPNKALDLEHGHKDSRACHSVGLSLGALKSHTQRLKGQRALLFTPLLSSLPSFSALADSGQQRPTTRYKSHFHVSRSRFATILGQNRPPTSTHGLPAPAIA